jgi:hypothetical protein
VSNLRWGSVDPNPYFIAKFTPDGVGSLFATTTNLNTIGLAVDSADDLYAVTANGFTAQVQRFTPDGAGSVFASSGLYNPMFIAIIPEPSTWALFSLGFSALSAFRRSRVPAGSPQEMTARMSALIQTPGLRLDKIW